MDSNSSGKNCVSDDDFVLVNHVEIMRDFTQTPAEQTCDVTSSSRDSMETEIVSRALSVASEVVCSTSDGDVVGCATSTNTESVNSQSCCVNIAADRVWTTSSEELLNFDIDYVDNVLEMFTEVEESLVIVT